MALYPTPHTAEWFDAVRRSNPTEAAHARRIVKLVGRSDVCSVCGDDPADDYKVVATAIPPNAVATVRLCPDCHEIRSYGGERLERL
jgi:hypothetical protein